MRVEGLRVKGRGRGSKFTAESLGAQQLRTQLNYAEDAEEKNEPQRTTQLRIVHLEREFDWDVAVLSPRISRRPLRLWVLCGSAEWGFRVSLTRGSLRAVSAPVLGSLSFLVTRHAVSDESV